MLKTSLLIVVLAVTLANGALAAARQSWPADNNYNSYNSAYDSQSNGEQLFDRAKGNID